MLLIFVENPTVKKLKSKDFPSNPEVEHAQYKWVITPDVFVKDLLPEQRQEAASQC